MTVKIRSTDAGDDVQFFEELAPQRFSVGFGWMALATGKFPVAFEVGPRRAEGQEEAVVPLDDRRDNDDGRHRQSVAGTGGVSGSQVRYAQKGVTGRSRRSGV